MRSSAVAVSYGLLSTNQMYFTTLTWQVIFYKTVIAVLIVTVAELYSMIIDPNQQILAQHTQTPNQKQKETQPQTLAKPLEVLANQELQVPQKQAFAHFDGQVLGGDSPSLNRVVSFAEQRTLRHAQPLYAQPLNRQESFSEPDLGSVEKQAVQNMRAFSQLVTKDPPLFEAPQSDALLSVQQEKQFLDVRPCEDHSSSVGSAQLDVEQNDESPIQFSFQDLTLQVPLAESALVMNSPLQPQRQQGLEEEKKEVTKIDLQSSFNKFKPRKMVQEADSSDRSVGLDDLSSLNDSRVMSPPKNTFLNPVSPRDFKSAIKKQWTVNENQKKKMVSINIHDESPLSVVEEQDSPNPSPLSPEMRRKMFQAQKIQSEIQNQFYDLLTPLINGIDIGLALFSGSKYSYNLKVCNNAFEKLFGFTDIPLDQIFNMPVFSQVGDQQRWTFFELINRSKTDIDKEEQVYQISSTAVSPVTQFFVAIKFFLVKQNNTEYIGTSLTNLTKVQKESLDTITQQYQQMMTNALSHERLTPLNAIINGCEFIQRKIQEKMDSKYKVTFGQSKTDAEIKQKSISQQSDLLAAILKEIDIIWASSQGMHMLTTSQLETYKLECNKLQPKAFNCQFQGQAGFRDYMNQLLISFAIKLSTRRSKISLRGDLEQLNDVCTDFHLFKSILYHLMQNAIKHSPPDNSIDIEIKLKPLPRQSANLTGFLEVTIKDYGLGFNASAVLSRDFKTFQLAGSNQTEIQGVGIGLATANTLACFLGGSLQIKSSRQKGTQVTFCVATTSMAKCASFSTDLQDFKLLTQPRKPAESKVDSIGSFFNEYQALGQPVLASKFKCIDEREENVVNEVVHIKLPFSGSCVSLLSVSEHMSSKKPVFNDVQKSNQNIIREKGHANFDEEKSKQEFKQQFKQMIMKEPENNSSQRVHKQFRDDFISSISRSQNLGNLSDKNGIKQVEFELSKKKSIVVLQNPVQNKFSNCTEICSKQVLLIDDDSFNLMTLQAMLDDLNITSEIFLTGQDAVRCYQQQLQSTCCSRSFDLVMTDIQMPEMNGFEVCQRIMATQFGWLGAMSKQSGVLHFKSKKACPVIAVTAFTDEGVHKEAKKVGMKEVIHKPVSQVMLINVLLKFTNLI